MAKDSSGEPFRVGSCGGDCSTSDVSGLQRRQQRLGEPFGQQQGGRLGEVGGGAAAERCMALLLPREVSRRVFSQLDYGDLVQCSLVCKQWHLESAELRQGWKEELYWEACCIRGVHFTSVPPGLNRLELYLAGSPD